MKTTVLEICVTKRECHTVKVKGAVEDSVADHIERQLTRAYHPDDVREIIENVSLEIVDYCTNEGVGCDFDFEQMYEEEADE